MARLHPVSPEPPPEGLLVQLPADPTAAWRWWRCENGALGAEHGFTSGDDPPWGELACARVMALVPSALAPVRLSLLPSMPLAQALAAARLEAAGEGVGAGERHVAVAAADGRLLVATIAAADMDLWLAELAANGLEPAVLLPAALVLPPPAAGALRGRLGEDELARTADAAFAAEPALLEALAGTGEVGVVNDEALADSLLAAFAAPPLNLRQGAYAPRRVSFFRVPDWRQLARMAAVAALLALVLMIVWIVKWNADSTAREEAALAAARERFPAATDLDTAERLSAAELTRRGSGGSGFSAPAAALLAAMQPIPSVSLRDLGYGADGTLRLTAAAPRLEDVNALLIALQREGWRVTVPPQLAPDPTGATVAAITVRAP